MTSAITRQGFIDLWFGDIDDPGIDGAGASTCLSAEEFRHAKGIRNERVRERFVHTRQKLRRALADYLQLDAREITIAQGRYGKPYLSHQSLFFNVSHSGKKLAVAVTDTAEIGVDIEQCRERPSLAELAKRCFAAEEFAQWRNLPDNNKVKGFYRYWTAKEAFVKATGRGLALGLEHCVIDPLRYDRFIHLPDGFGNTGDWRLISMDLGDYCGAVVIKSGGHVIELHKKDFGSLSPLRRDNASA